MLQDGQYREGRMVWLQTLRKDKKQKLESVT